MANYRLRRIGEQIKKEMSQLIQVELKDPRIGFITLTSVDVTNDLSLARVYLSILGNDDQREATLKALGKAKGYLRKEIAHRIKMRHTPELEFHFDQSLDYASHIKALLHQINDQTKKF